MNRTPMSARVFGELLCVDASSMFACLQCVHVCALHMFVFACARRCVCWPAPTSAIACMRLCARVSVCATVHACVLVRGRFYVCMRACRRGYMRAHTHARVCAYMNVFMCACLCLCPCVCAFVFVCVRLREHIGECWRIWLHVLMYMRAGT